MATTRQARSSRVLDPVLDAVRTRRSERDSAEVALLKSVLDWAVEHTVDAANEDSLAATYIESFGDTGLTLAGPGAPCASEFDTYELAATLGMTSESGKRYVGHALDVRRSIATGELAGRQLSLDLTTGETDTGSTGRGVTIVVHVSDPTITRYGRQLISVDQVIAWCQAAGTTVMVQPLIDLNEAIQVAAYEIPDRIHQLVELRDHHCVFPHCTRPARCCDTDHITPYAKCATTDSDDLATLCRMHHRTKTHSAWTYYALTPGEYLWTSPRGLRFKTDHTGTTELDP